MKKLLKPKDILLLILAGVGDLSEEIKDPMQIMARSYKSMYGYIPWRYKRSNFLQTVGRSLKTGDIEKIVKDGQVFLRLTSAGKEKAYRDFPILKLTQKWNKQWVIIVFDITEKAKDVRNKLRNKLRSIGFGMLQESVWISPLEIGEDVKEFIDSVGLSNDVFVIEISGFILGDPRDLAKRIWNLDKLEKEYLKLENKIRDLNQLIEKLSDRIKNREAKTGKEYYYQLRKRRQTMRERLEFIASFPALPSELLPKKLRNIFLMLPK